MKGERSMSKNLEEIAEDLATITRVQLIYAFNGSGKTRLSRKFKTHIENRNSLAHCDAATDFSPNGVLYYSAFTEDLFYWDNDLEADSDTSAAPRLKIQPNAFTNWLIALLEELGEDGNIATNFQRYTASRINPVFNDEKKRKVKDFNGAELEITIPRRSEINFQVTGNIPEGSNPEWGSETDESGVVDGHYKSIKISKGEESNFIWSVFFTLLQQVVAVLNEAEDDRATAKFNNFEYVFIDDPVSSLDDNHLIKLAVNLAELIKSSSFKDSKGLKFIVTTHNPLFYNVLYNELNHGLKQESSEGTTSHAQKGCPFKKSILKKNADGTFELTGSNDHPFAYHLFLLTELQVAISEGNIRKYHFNFLRNILEKTATFLGHPHWSDLLKRSGDTYPDPHEKRLLNLFSHSAHAGEEVTDIQDSDKQKLTELVSFLSDTYHFKKA